MDLNLVEHLHLDLNRFQYLEQSGWTQVCRWLRISVKNLLGQLLSLFAGICFNVRPKVAIDGKKMWSEMCKGKYEQVWYFGCSSRY